MATYRMDDGTVVKTENATLWWAEATRFDGHNIISVPTGSQWDHEKLYRSRRGRYWLEHTYNYEGKAPRAEWVSNHEAVAWLLANDHPLPEDLVPLESEVCE